LKFATTATRSIQVSKKFLTQKVELKDLTNVTATKSNFVNINNLLKKPQFLPGLFYVENIIKVCYNNNVENNVTRSTL